MFQKIRYYLSVGGFCLKMNIKSQAEYPAFLFGWVLANALQFLTGLGTLYVLSDRFHSLGGWSFEELFFLYGLSIVSHGLSIVFLSGNWGIEWHISEGEFDRLLVRPLSVIYQYAVSRCNLIGLTDLIPGIMILITGCRLVRFQLTAYHLVWLIFVLLGAMLIRGSIYQFIGTIAFWTRRSYPLVDVVLSLFTRTNMYPLTAFPKVVQMVLTFVLPFGFIAFYPAGELLGKDTGLSLPGGFALWTLFIGVFLYVLSLRFFSKGLRVYEGAGS